MPSPRIIVDSPLGPDAFVFRHLSGREELGRLFTYELELTSAKRDLALKDVLGQDLTVKVDLPDDTVRYFHGFVSELVVTGSSGKSLNLRATIRPWFWFLTRTSNSRIYQNLTVPDIIKELLRERGFTDFEDALSGTYRTWEYVVQYRETDFNFISRLMEQEGIYYYFKHEQGKHTLVMCDGYGAHHPVPNYEQVPYYPPDPNERREKECIDAWQLTQQVQPGTYVLDDFDFKRPKADLQVKLSAPAGHERDDFEMYDYPGEYVQASEGETYVKVRLEELAADFERTTGQGNARGLHAGALFSLVDFPRDDQNQEYLILSASYDITDVEEESAGGTGGPMYRVSITCLKSSVPFRSARTTPRPVVWGPQTATVVGKSGEEIWTDEHGRVKVRFHWDRGETADENASCWVRVSQAWAGAGWGSMHVPRIGHEVIVSFLEGDPDRPLVTGRVYNGDNKPPFSLPGSAMVSGFKSDSTPGGGGNNEISFDDTKGAEKITIHGQYDMASTIGHDQTLDVTNNRTTNIGVNDTETVGSAQTISVGADQTVDITGSQITTIGASQTTTVTADCTLSITGGHTITVGSMSTESIAIAKALSIGAGYAVSVGGGMNVGVGAASIEEVAGLKSVNVGAASIEAVAAKKSIVVGGAMTMKAKSIAMDAATKVSVKAGSDMTINGKNGVVDMGSELTLKVGGATINFKGGNITIKASKITIDASGDLITKGANIKQN